MSWSKMKHFAELLTHQPFRTACLRRLYEIRKIIIVHDIVRRLFSWVFVV